MGKSIQNRRAIYWLSSAHGITDIYSGFLTPLMPFLAIKLGFSIAIATMLISISQVIASTLQPLFGYFADITKRRSFIFWGLILCALSNPIATNVNHFWLLFVFIILGNLGGSMFHPQAMGLIPYFSDKNSIKNMSIFVTLGTIGFALGPVISSFIYQFWGSKYLIITSIVGILTAFSLFIFVPKLTNMEFSSEKKIFLKAIKDICTHKIMLILIIMGLMKTLIQSSCSIMMPFLWKSMGYTPVFIGFAMFLFLFAGGIGSLLSHWFENKFGAKFVFYSSMIITFPLMIIYALTYKTMPVLSLIIFIIIGFLTAFAQPVTIIMAQKTLPQYKGIISGIINGFTWGLVAVLLITLGFAAEKIGIIKILIFLSFFPAIASFFVKYLPNNIDE